jgi:hypothetical protein
MINCNTPNGILLGFNNSDIATNSFVISITSTSDFFIYFINSKLYYHNELF